MALYKAEGIVIRTRDLGDADRIVTLLTKEKGKLKGVARGARRTRNRLSGNTEFLTHAQFLLFSGKSLETVSQSYIIQTNQKIRADLIRMAYAMYMAEVMDKMVEEGEENEALFKLLHASLSELAEWDYPKLPVLKAAYQIKLVSVLGYMPQIGRCLSCRNANDFAVFSAAEGGVLCSSCKNKAGDGIEITKKTVEALRVLLLSEMKKLKDFTLSKSDQRLLLNILNRYLEYRLPGELHSLSFLNSIISE